MGPRVDFQVRRLHLASDDHFAEAYKQVQITEKILFFSGRVSIKFTCDSGKESSQKEKS